MNEEVKTLLNKLVLDSKDTQNIGGLLSKLRSSYPVIYQSLNEKKNFLGCKSIGEVIYLIINNMESIPLCPDCKERYRSFKDFKSGYKERCTKCATLYSRNITANVQRKYGVKNTMNIPGIIEKRDQKFFDKHGVKNSKQLKETNDKMEKTNLDRYGFTCSLLNEDVKKKSLDKRLELYGTDHHMKTKEYKQNFHDRVANTEEFQNNLKNIIHTLDKYNLELVQPYKNAVTNLILRCKICNTIFEGSCWMCYKQDHNHIETACKKCHPPKGICFSIEEVRIIDYIKQRIPNIEVIHRKGSRLILDNYKELDVYFPQYKLAVEYCGLFRHNSSDIIDRDGKTKDPNAHYNKYIECLQKGIHLITVFDKRKSDNWIDEIYQKLIKADNIDFNSLNLIEKEDGKYFELDNCQYSYETFPLKNRFELIKQLPPKCWFYNDILHPEFIDYDKFKECYCTDGEDPFEFAKTTEYCKWYYDCGWQLLKLKE